MTSSPEPLTTADLVVLDASGDDTRGIVGALASRLAEQSRVTDTDAFVEAVMKREALEPTALPGGVAIPHARHGAVSTLSVAVGRLAAPAVFAEGKPAVDVVLLIAAPDEDPSAYLALLAKIAGACVRSSFRSSLRSAQSPDEVATIVSGAIGRI